MFTDSSHHSDSVLYFGACFVSEMLIVVNNGYIISTLAAILSFELMTKLLRLNSTSLLLIRQPLGNDNESGAGGKEASLSSF